jgi:ribose transport system permease protein
MTTQDRGATAQSRETEEEASAAASTPAGDVRPSLGRIFSATSPVWIFLVLVALVLLFTFTEWGRFLTVFDVRNMLVNGSIDLVMGVGMTFVIITAGIDLSVGSVLVFSGVIAIKAMSFLSPHADATNAGWGVIVAGLIAGLLAGLAWGVVWNGLLVARAKVPALIVTLGSFGAALGLAQVLTGGNDATDVPSKLLNTVGTGQLGPVPWLVIIALVVVVLGGLLLTTTRFGRYTFAIGSNDEAARRTGIRVSWHLVKVYALAGLLSGLAGDLALAHFDTTSISSHTNDNLVVVTAVILGGTSLFGGTGTMLGTLVGVFIPVVLEAGLVIYGVQTYWQSVAVGVVLVLAVYADQLRRRSRHRT